MSSNAAPNPYQPSAVDPVNESGGLTRLQKTLLFFVIMALLVRGGFMAFSWCMLLVGGIELTSNFYAAIFTKDLLYSLTALIGGVFLLLRHPVGWWSAVLHWYWYLACEVAVVATAEALGWQTPVRQAPPSLFRVMAVSGLFAVAALIVLYWEPIRARYIGKSDRAKPAGIYAMSTCLLVAFVINGWISLR
jgi:hypothetical protein